MTEKDNSKRTTKLVLGVSVPVLVMGLVSFFTDVSSESINSILSLFILDLAPNNPAFYLGLIAGVTTALSNILKGVSGWMSDKVNKRKPFVVAGYTISNLSKPFIGLAPSWQVVLGLKATDRVGKGLRTSSRDTLISYYAVEKGKAFGMHRAMDTLGAVVGSLLASLFLLWAWSYSQIIFFSIFPGICAIILIFLIKDVDPTKLDETKLKYYGEPKVDTIDRRFIKLIILLGVIEFASLDIAFLQARSLDFIFTGFVFLIPAFYLLTNIIYMFFSPITGSLSDKIGRKPIIIIGLSLLLFSCIILAFPVQTSLFSFVIIIIIYAFYGIYLASVDPISRAYIADLAGKNKRGRAYGYYYLSVGFISLAESLLFGFIYETVSPTWAFLYTAILLFIFIIVFALTDFSKIIKKEE
ncbi:MAG: MFS transporter [Promethearchaeota archaeon]|jgi:MFS family permease